MTKLRILYTQDAVDDLDSIFDYISQDKRTAAANLLEKIENSILKLADNPRMGTVLPTNDLSLVEPGYRRIVVQPYLIFYRTGNGEIIIARVLHSRQDWMNLLFENSIADE
ncbi:MAG TPA: type II toxin-antitoxin system RelE/ParE family toxin [Syntrophomonadaceae bacterium]|nr:type II toxin-antitoxin system RelE/ParE family toxin [Syntrophomonadaceae bacterium]HPR94378.1 type II toxin-antitoxin system RelE/ParE family toxin [Syntrophomonadaceae bacterium]